MPSESAPTLRESIETARRLREHWERSGLHRPDTAALRVLEEAAEALEGLERLLRAWFTFEEGDGIQACWWIFHEELGNFDGPTLPAAINAAVATLEEKP